MKKLITANDVKKMAGSGEKIIHMGPGTIITPAAKDAARELDISLLEGNWPSRQTGEAPPAAGVECKSGISPELIARIVKEVIASLSGEKQSGMIKESDPSGLRLVRGHSVVYGSDYFGKSGNKVNFKEIFTKNECPHIEAGFMALEKTSLPLELESGELYLITEGSVEVMVDGRTFRGEAGDVVLLPGNKNLVLSVSDRAKLFFVRSGRLC